MTDPIGTDAISNIAKRYLMPGYGFVQSLSAEEKRNYAQKKALEFKGKTDAGLIPIHEDENNRWQRSGPYDYFGRWVTKAAWDRYVDALAELIHAEANLA